jgi:hypothetical protein
MSFEKYTAHVFAAMQITSRLLWTKRLISQALWCCVLVHCMPKLRLRVNTFWRLFSISNLKPWVFWSGEFEEAKKLECWQHVVD